ncbi:hypothetical protein FRB90_009501 [Tulasnella sp. 427]|nr:hypothetical protein FRB90_009501 [Tulasnella sp. 427]
MSSAESSPSSKFVVPPPFDSSSPGDCVLQSADGVQFKALRQILAFGSSVMADMFSLPQPAKPSKGEQDNSNDDELPVIPMGEDAETILNLLLLLYPPSMPSQLGVHAALKLADAHDKYMIPKNRLCTVVRAYYWSRPVLEASPLELYNLAWKLDMKEEARVSSRYTHRVPLKDLCASLSAEPLEKLLDLRRRREEILDYVVAHLDPRKSICHFHSGDQWEYHKQYSALKTRIRQSLQDPYLEGKSASEFFGQKSGVPPLEGSKSGEGQVADADLEAAARSGYELIARTSSESDADGLRLQLDTCSQTDQISDAGNRHGEVPPPYKEKPTSLEDETL